MLYIPRSYIWYIWYDNMHHAASHWMTILIDQSCCYSFQSSFHHLSLLKNTYIHQDLYKSLTIDFPQELETIPCFWLSQIFQSRWLPTLECCPGKWEGWTNPFEKICSSNWIISPSRVEHKKYLKPPRKRYPEHTKLMVQKSGVARRTHQLIR